MECFRTRKEFPGAGLKVQVHSERWEASGLGLKVEISYVG